jgi:hypothetical protein
MRKKPPEGPRTVTVRRGVRVQADATDGQNPSLETRDAECVRNAVELGRVDVGACGLGAPWLR